MAEAEGTVEVALLNPCSSRATQRWWPPTVLGWILVLSEEGDCTTALGTYTTTSAHMFHVKEASGGHKAAAKSDNVLCL